MKKASTVISTDLAPLPNDDAVGKVRLIKRLRKQAKWYADDDTFMLDAGVANNLSKLLTEAASRLERAEGGRDEGVSGTYSQVEVDAILRAAFPRLDEGVSRIQPCAEAGPNSPSSPPILRELKRIEDSYTTTAVMFAARNAADWIRRLVGLVEALVDNEPDDMAADGVTVLQVWRHDARGTLQAMWGSTPRPAAGPESVGVSQDEQIPSTIEEEPLPPGSEGSGVWGLGAGGWGPIEGAPRDGTQVDIWADGTRWANVAWQTSHAAWGRFERRYKHTAMIVYTGLKPTHWMPLPEAPR